MITSKPARFKRIDLAENALDRLEVQRGRLVWHDSAVSNDEEWLELTRRFVELTGCTVGRYLRTLRESGDEMPEPAAELMRAMLGKLNGPSAYGSPAASD